jgi:hypothetical protein
MIEQHLSEKERDFLKNDQAVCRKRILIFATFFYQRFFS